MVSLHEMVMQDAELNFFNSTRQVREEKKAKLYKKLSQPIMHMTQALADKENPPSLDTFDLAAQALVKLVQKKNASVILAKHVLAALQEPSVDVPEEIVVFALKTLNKAKVGQKRLAPKIMEAAGMKPKRSWNDPRQRYHQNRYAPR